MSENQTDQFAIVELFGHARIAGRISEQTICGQGFVRVDVPAVTYVERSFDTSVPHQELTIPAHTRSFGADAIYSINWCDEAAATLAAQSIKHRPIQPYSLKNVLGEMTDRDRQRLLAGPVMDLNDDLPY